MRVRQSQEVPGDRQTVQLGGLFAEQQNGLETQQSVDEGHGGARGRLPEKEAIDGRGRDLAPISLPRTCPKSLLFLSPSQEEEEGLPLLLANAPHTRVLFASSSDPQLLREIDSHVIEVASCEWGEAPQ